MPTISFHVGPDRDIPVRSEDAAPDPAPDPSAPDPGAPDATVSAVPDGPALPVVSPATGAVFAHCPLARAEDIHVAVDAAARCLSLWRGAPFPERARRLRRLAALILDQRQAIATTISREQGKPYVEALSLEVLPALDHLRFIIRHAERFHAGLAVEPRHPLYIHKRAHYLYDPVGVVALITPSPLPFAVPLIQTAAALAMGNAVVLKPSEHTPLSALRIGELCLEAGFPADLVTVVPAAADEVLHLALHPKVDKLFFTGSLEAGRSVMSMAGCAVRPIVLGLGGKHAAIVAADADVARAARGIVWGALANAGQNCGAIERVFVEEGVASVFMEHLLAEVDRVRLGDPLEPGTDLGPLLTAERREIVHARVLDADARGAKIVRGGAIPDGPGYFYPPTVVLDPPLDCDLMQEETPGPVIPVVVAESIERALMLANQTEYALTASGWTRSPETAERLMSGLQAGVVTINDALYSFGEPASTWSGFRRSGMGQNHGTPGLREMSRQKFASFDPAPTEAPLFAFPYDRAGQTLVEAALTFLNQPRGWRRLWSLLRLMRLERFRQRTPLRGLFGASRRQI